MPQPNPQPLFFADKVVLLTGGRGLLGKALQAQLRLAGVQTVLTPKRVELDLLDGAKTKAYFESKRPDIVFHLASIVFGLFGNMTHQISAIADSTIMNHNVLMTCAEYKVAKVFMAGSVASYPFPYKSLPLTEDQFWNGLPHAGEFGYAHAKRHALAYLEVLHQSLGMEFFYGVLTNLYGPEDKFDETNGHVIPSLIQKMHKAKHGNEALRVWGDGSAKRDFMHVNDAARAIIHGMPQLKGIANISTGMSVSIKDIVDALVVAADFTGDVVWEVDKPVGVPERSVSNEILRSSGFRCQHDLQKGIRDTWDWFQSNADRARV